MTTVGDALFETHRNTSKVAVIAIASFIIAVLAFIAASFSAYYSYQDSIADERWQNEQLELMIKIVEAETKNNSELININSNAQKLQTIVSEISLKIDELEIRNNERLKNQSGSKPSSIVTPQNSTPN